MAMPAPTLDDSTSPLLAFDIDPGYYPLLEGKVSIIKESAYMRLCAWITEHGGDIRQLLLPGDVAGPVDREMIGETDEPPKDVEAFEKRLTYQAGAWTALHAQCLQTICRIQKRLPDPANETKRLPIATLAKRLNCSPRTAARAVDDLIEWKLVARDRRPAGPDRFPETWLSPVRIPGYEEEHAPTVGKVKDAARKRCPQCKSEDLVDRRLCRSCGYVLSTTPVNPVQAAGDMVSESDTIPPASLDGDRMSLHSTDHGFGAVYCIGPGRARKGWCQIPTVSFPASLQEVR